MILSFSTLRSVKTMKMIRMIRMMIRMTITMMTMMMTMLTMMMMMMILLLSTPRTSSCCGATTSARLSTGYMDSTMSVSHCHCHCQYSGTIDQISPPAFCKTWFSVSEWFWQAKNYLINLQKKLGLRRPPPTNSQIILHFFSAPHHFNINHHHLIFLTTPL